ncbi:hypothetical protein NitYY0826_P31 (plasmid) [Nitratiruptor sp. YY08-26]|uniref:hypothetical protein n=1 Tax=unclassified Nitratiruptor TaxID=2624044 RepID=UPI0018ECA953|nr:MULTISPECIES: hypothetical protein [unclassified Nitratiruptor]BCD63190.1 hypothetical protein NitYY0813_P31 [Nitratiruptor sp. YY08-13]BCD67126.1 hypothetical protein NitYY0826_P31 [Nitratiruptor sp. YY08-26]
MKKSFTIIEVIISVVILTLIGTALLKNAGVNLNFLKKIIQKNETIHYMTIISLHRNPNFNHLSKHLEDFLDKSYFIDDDGLQKLLKKTKVQYQEQDIKISMPVLEGFKKEEETTSNPIDISFIKIYARFENSGDFLYVLQLNE